MRRVLFAFYGTGKAAQDFLGIYSEKRRRDMQCAYDQVIANND